MAGLCFFHDDDDDDGDDLPRLAAAYTPLRKSRL